MVLSEVRALLDIRNISYEEMLVENQAEFIGLLGFPCADSAFPVPVLTICNPHHQKNILLVFRNTAETLSFDEVYFGGFTPDFSRSTDEFLREAIPEFIENVVSGRMHIIERHDARNGAWTGDAMYLDSADEAENDMDAFEAAVRRIRKERRGLARLLSERYIHEIYSWSGYEQIGTRTFSSKEKSHFLTKRQKIRQYLDGIPAEGRSPFDRLLEDSLSGVMKEHLLDFGLSRLQIHIDWHDDYRCINIDGRIRKKYVDLQVEPDQFSLACDEDEPDDHIEYPLESAGQFYAAAKRLAEE